MPFMFDTPTDDSTDELQLDIEAIEADFDQDEPVQVDNVSDVKPEIIGVQNFEEGSVPARGSRLSHISPPPLVFPPSAYGMRPQSTTCERRLIRLLESEQPEAFKNQEIELDNFVVYTRSNSQFRMVSLDQVAVKVGRAIFFFDGQIVVGGKSHYLEKIPFALVSVGGYEELEQHTVDDSLWIQSSANECLKNGLWYRLKRPAIVHKPHYELFSWLANLAKHLLHYLHEHENMTLEHFRADFVSWLTSIYGMDEGFTNWREQYPKSDFRHAIVAHADFLQKQALDMDAQSNDIIYDNHLLWHEINPSVWPNLVMKNQPQTTEGTIVTPYVRRCFRKMGWGHFLNAKEPRPEISRVREDRCKAMGFGMTIGGLKPHFGCDSGGYNGIQIGDVVLVPPDEKTKWKDGDKPYFALVQDIKPQKRDARLFVIWLYRPSETICSNLTYPEERELFLSSHCNCHDDPLFASEVIEKIGVTWFATSPSKEGGYFVRQTYTPGDAAFTTLKDEDFTCSCRKEDEVQKYSPGDTILAETFNPEGEFRLEPAEILAVNGEEIQIRPLRFRSRYDECRPNELLYTSETSSIMLEQVDRICHVRTFTSSEPIPAPYDRDGTGDFFFIRKALRDGEIVPLECQPTFKQGFGLDQPRSKLRALNIFCGGGTFDRGLEEGGCIQSEWAVEWDTAAMLTYRANHKSDHPLKMFCGSVNDYLYKAKNGDNGELVARLGEVDFISAGSPCQGYSTANQHKDGDTSQKNSSMIASVASYVDFYRPKYAILENVVSMSNSKHERNPLSQLVCAFVGMGYQVRVLKLDAWSFGAPQSRSRLFVLIAAPGLELPARPSNSHSHTANQRSRSLGRGPSGETFGDLHWDTPVFKFITAKKATKDLPNIGKAQIAQVDWPDHRNCRFEPVRCQEVINSVPKYSKEQGIKSAVARGRLRADHPGIDARKIQRAINRSWTRIDPDGLIPTVTTTCNPFCIFTGKRIHWDQDRLMTVQEARRAQGYPDHEVLIGNPKQQWKIVGNSVARQVALVLGLKIREACEKDEARGVKSTLPVEAPIAPILAPLHCRRSLSSVIPNRASNFSIIIENPGRAQPSNDCDVRSSSTPKLQKSLEHSSERPSTTTLTDRSLSSTNFDMPVTMPSANFLSPARINASVDEELTIKMSVVYTRKRSVEDQGERVSESNAAEEANKEKENLPHYAKRIRLSEHTTENEDAS
ncbi:DNA methyltransferase Dim-2 [Ascosphaera pollenicola]|nr:DNA methyltransferase Dim-2 [Ascosphaera pollenicola]